MTQRDSENSMLPLEQHATENARRPAGLVGKAARAVQITRHYNLAQIARRGLYSTMRRLTPGKLVGQTDLGSANLRTSDLLTQLARLVIRDHSSHPSHERCDLDSGIFVLLNYKVQAGTLRPTQEILASQTHLWRFQFHYHEFLLTQAANKNWSVVNEFLRGWLSDYAPEKTRRSDDSWHPYCISRRTVAWVWLLTYSRDQGDALSSELTQQLLQSLIHQTQYLSDHLEWELGGNHLLENATALSIVGGTLNSSGSQGWQKIARNILERELAKQILPHGEHFELSPMYHCQILGNLLRIELCCQNDDKLISLVSPYIEPMLKFLVGILHPDNEIPLFGDSGFQEAPSVQQLVDIASLSGHTAQQPIRVEGFKRLGDYFILNANDTFAVCDFGEIAAPQLPAHGHCDLLNLEVSIGNDRWIVDSGNFNYSDDSMRDYCRSSIGHNVVTLDDANQANVWSIFRMGTRPSVSDQRQGKDSDWHWASASHNGHSSEGVHKLTRLVVSSPGNLICIDTVSLKQESAGDLVGYLHLHPKTTLGEVIRVTNSIFRIQLRRSGTLRWLTISADEVTIERGWFCEQFGKRTAGPVIRYLTNITKPFTWWVLQETPDHGEIEFLDSSIQITMGSLDKFSWKIA